LQDVIAGERDEAKTVKAATGSKKFINYTISKHVFATPWDGNIRIEADDEGGYKVFMNQ
jgi:hypothetical protein